MSKAVYTWQQPAKGVPDSYNLYVGPASGAEVLLINVPGTQTTYTQLGTIPGPYFGLVKAVYAGVETIASNEASAFANTPYNIPRGQTQPIGVFGTGFPINDRRGSPTWDVASQGAVIATSDNPFGWNCRVVGGSLVVTASSTAAINALNQPYTVRYDDGS